MKYVFTASELIARQFTREVYEGKENEPEGSKYRPGAVGGALENMFKPYDLNSPISALVRAKAKEKGMTENRYYAAYPMYKVSEQMYVYYDAENERTAILYKPTITKSTGEKKSAASWYVRFGDLKAEDTTGPDEKRTTAATAKDNYTKAVDLWFIVAIDHMVNKDSSAYKPVSTKSVLPVQYDLFRKTIAPLYTSGIMKMPRLNIPIESETGEFETRPTGGTNVTNDMLNINAFNRSAGAKGILSWYEDNIGKLSDEAGGSEITKTTKAFGRQTIGDMFRYTGLLNSDFNERYDNVTLMRIINEIVQQNPHAAADTKKKWREILLNIYQKYAILDTRDLTGRNEEYIGPELYNAEAVKKINDPQLSSRIRSTLLGLTTNYWLKGIDEAAPDRFKNKGDEDQENLGLRRLPRTEKPRSGFKNESLFVPTFSMFMFEAETQKRRYSMKFEGDITQDEIFDISPAIAEVRLDSKKPAYSAWWVEARESISEEDIRKYLAKRNEEEGTDIRLLGFAEIAATKATDDWYVTFTEGVGESDILGIDGVKAVVSLGSNRKWRVTAEAGVNPRDGLEKMAMSRNINFTLEKTAAVSRLESEMERERKEKERKDKILAKTPFADRVKIVNKTISGGVYVSERGGDNFRASMMIFDAIQNLGGYVVAEYTDDKYQVSVVPSEDNFSMLVPTNQDITNDTVVISTERGYLARANESDRYVDDITNPIVTKFPSEEDAKTALPHGSARILNYLDELSAELRADFNKIKAIYDANAGNTLFILKADKEKSYADNKKAKSIEEFAKPEFEQLIDDMFVIINAESIKTSGEKAAKRVLTGHAKRSGHMADYSSIKNPELKDDLEVYGTDVAFFHTATPSDYLEKAANIINKMSEAGIKEDTVSKLVNDWYYYAGLVLALGGKTLRRGGGTSEIPEDAIEAVSQEGDVYERTEKDDPVSSFAVKAFTQMFIREIGNVHVIKAMLHREKPGEMGSGRGQQAENFAGEMNKYISDDYLSTSTISEIVSRYLGELNNEQNNRPPAGRKPGAVNKGVSKARHNVLDVVKDVFRALGTAPAKAAAAKIEDLSAKMPIDDELIDEIASAIESGTLDVGATAEYKKELADAISELYNMSIGK